MICENCGKYFKKDKGYKVKKTDHYSAKGKKLCSVECYLAMLD